MLASAGLQPSVLPALLYLLLFGVLAAAAIRPVYNVFFHPLRKYPGPRIWAASQLPWTYFRVTGRLPQKSVELHRKYGSVVRVAPDHLSYTTESAWNTIYGLRKDEMQKNVLAGFSRPGIPGVQAILTADKPNHARLRRILAPGFNDQAVKGYEGKIISGADILIDRLSVKARERTIVDLNKYLEWTSMDIISDVLCGSPHGALSKEDGGDWLEILTYSIRGQVLFQALELYDLSSWRKYFLPDRTLNAPIRNFKTIAGKLEETLSTSEGDADPKDSLCTAAGHMKGMDRTEAILNAASIVGAGTGTTATWMSTIIHCLMTNPDACARAQREVRTAFDNTDSMGLENVSKLPYLHAVLTEALRIHCPSPSSTGRLVPTGGATIDGAFVPAGTTVGVPQHAAYHSEANFRHANEYLPERWLDPTKEPAAAIYVKDVRGVLKPWSMGPRTCLGIKLSSAMVQLIVAKLLWHFSFEIVPESLDWRAASKATVAWHREPLYCKIRSSGKHA